MAEDEQRKKIETLNQWGITSKDGMILGFVQPVLRMPPEEALRLGQPVFQMTPEEALRLAAWLVIAVGLEADRFAWERFRKVYSACLCG